MDLKEVFFEEWNLLVGIVLLISVVILNLSGALYQNIISFQETMYISLIIMASTIASYLLFRLKKDIEEIDTEEAEKYSSKILSNILSELRDGESPTDKQIETLLKGHSELYIHQRQEAYEFASDIAKDATEQLVVLQQTPLLLFGPRPYFEEPKIEYESELFESFKSFAELSNEDNFEFYCAYSIGVTKEEIGAILDERPDYKQYLAKRLYKLCEDSASNNIGFTFSAARDEWTPGYHYISADDRFAIWFRDPGYEGQYLCLSSNHEGAANIFRRILESSFEKTDDYEVAAEELGLEDSIIEQREARNLNWQDLF